MGLRLYDPAYLNTAMATSRICYIDGDKGVLTYRGYPIEELAEKSSFLEVAFLLINGNLPNRKQLDEWSHKIMTHTYIHENLTSLMKNFRYDAHPMGMLISSIAAMSTFYPEANAALSGQDIYKSVTLRNKQMYRIIGKLPTIAACAYRHRIGRPYTQPRSDLGYTENFLYMMDHLGESDFKPHPKLVRALDVLFILHADHEMNCSTAAMRHIASSLADPYTAVAGAAGALYGPLHGGANEAVLRMLTSIGSVENVPAFIEEVKSKKKKLMGFGHRVYKNYDPRAKIIRSIAYEVFEVMGKEPLVEVALALEKVALTDDYFVKRQLYPNVDFFTGLIYKSMGFPTDMFPVLFTIPRAVGWLAHWLEFLDDPENKIVRPRQVYKGEENRHYVAMVQRDSAEFPTSQVYSTLSNKRREASEK
eukprot:TRINITY_DN19679_c0_g1_i1.p1 TRINITY_DN19679_c0_g1~~TRINITY_DN19679_c0_g1_i1.p1  ORF type:complete len:490 (-),score=136.98 TRINITY_DN19679_c0_g1_i1:64-1323(-)